MMKAEVTTPQFARRAAIQEKPQQVRGLGGATTDTHRPLVLILGQHDSAVDRLRATLRSSKFKVKTHSDPNIARNTVNAEKLDGVFLFWGAAGSIDVLRELRASSLNRSCIVCAVLTDPAQQREAFSSGCNFTFDLQSLGNNLQRLIRIMSGLVVKEHRRYFRSSAPVEVTFLPPAKEGMFAHCLDLSTTGIGLQVSPPAIMVDDRVTLAIDLADGNTAIRAEAQVRWTEPGGKAGLNFVQMPVVTLERLQAWIEKSIEAADRLAKKSLPTF